MEILKKLLAKIRADKRLLIGIPALAVVLLLGFIYIMTNSSEPKRQTSNTPTVTNQPSQEQAKKPAPPPDVRWDFDFPTNTWKVMSGTAPQCPNPIFKQSPTDLSLVNTIGFPGQYRSKDYKPHGLFGYSGHKAEDVKVYMPMDAKLVRLVRYNESNELQYLLVFENDCGIGFRFDHLFTLAPDFQAIAETTPPPKTDDTSSLPLPAPVTFKAGDLIATAVGHPAQSKIGFDFGVYDYRQPNEISKNEQWRALHTQYAATEWYGICWFDLLPGGNAEKAKQLSRVWVNTNYAPRFTSDYCANADHTTLNVEGGRPTAY
jgi:hypothetical protein